MKQAQLSLKFIKLKEYEGEGVGQVLADGKSVRCKQDCDVVVVDLSSVGVVQQGSSLVGETDEQS